MSISVRVTNCIVNLLGVNVEDVKPESTLGDLGADSLDAVELIMALEEDFKIQIPDCEDAFEGKTVQSIVDQITKLTC